MQTEKLLQLLTEQSAEAINMATQLKTASLQSLTWRPAPGSWNTLECFEHLNLYGNFYIPAVEKAIGNAKPQKDTEFRSGILGNYFANSMMPKEKLNRMKTFKDKDPIHADLDISVIDTFIQQQLTTIDLLKKAKEVSLNKIKIPTSISSLIRLKLGDTFRFLINHTSRHIKQIKNIQEGYHQQVKGLNRTIQQSATGYKTATIN
ncbi:MAG: DinB family protein [Ferruginibacter sp.]